MNEHTGMGSGAEFDTIRRLLSVWGETAVDIGDDAAITIPPPGMQLVVSTDAAVDGVHFESSWIEPRAIGARAATAALSDLAAMGAKAAGVLVSFTVPSHWLGRLEEVAQGIGDTVRKSGASIVGGNMSAGPVFSITTTVLGYAGNPVRRTGAAPGDAVVVTGRLGGPGAALDVLKRDGAVHAGSAGYASSGSWAMSRLLAPEARLSEGEWLAAKGATAMIDISDGLAADTLHLATASVVLIVLSAGAIPVGDGIPLASALASGEEYELLATIPATQAREIIVEFNARFGVGLTQIGVVEAVADAVAGAVADAPGVVLAEGEPGDRSHTRKRVELPRGHDHFNRI